MESHKYSQCNNFNEQTKQKEEEIAETYFNENLVDFFLIKKIIRKYFSFYYSNQGSYHSTGLFKDDL